MTLTIEEFGERLLVTEDLDPIYVALLRMRFNAPQIGRWLLAYWCFYDAGFACYTADMDACVFWDAMRVAARNEVPTPHGSRWPRAAERRHFRGSAAVEAVRRLEERWPDPEDMALYVARGSPASRGDDWATCAATMKRAKEHYLFGDWIAFKAADMVERMGIAPITFTDAQVFMFDSPSEAAIALYRERQMGLPAFDDTPVADKAKAIAWSVEHLQKVFGSRKAPPGHERMVGLQEIETILCKWKSHMRGHYEIGQDIVEIRHGLAPWCKPNSGCKRHQLAQQFCNFMPQLGYRDRQEFGWASL